MDHHSASLPAGYKVDEAVDLTSRGTQQALALTSLVITILAMAAVSHGLRVLRPDWNRWDVALVQLLDHRVGAVPLGMTTLVIAGVLGLWAMLRLIVLIHEAIHGLTFWLFTRAQPNYGFLGGCAYCALRPGRFLPRNRYILALLAPLVIISGVVIALLAWVPLVWVPLAALVLVVHSAAAVGDLWIAGTLLARSPATYIWDAGTTVVLYTGGA